MSDISAGTGASAAANGSQGQPAGGAPQGQGSGEQTPSEYSLAEGFLGRVPQEHRAIVEPYVRQWDAGVTRRFQELQSQIDGYSQYGDMETIDAAMGLAQMMQENPWQVYGILQQALQAGEFGPPQGQGVGQQQQQPQQLPGQYPSQQDQGQLGPDGVPIVVSQRLDQITQAVLALGQQFMGQQSQAQEAEEDAQLDEWLEQMHAEFGDFDDRYFLLGIYEGKTPEEAFGEWNQIITGRATQQLQANGAASMPLLGGGGGGGVPVEGPTVKNLSRGQTKDLVAQVLAQRAQQGQ